MSPKLSPESVIIPDKYIKSKPAQVRKRLPTYLPQNLTPADGHLMDVLVRGGNEVRADAHQQDRDADVDQPMMSVADSLLLCGLA